MKSSLIICFSISFIFFQAFSAPINFQNGTATFSQVGYSVDDAIDGVSDPDGWAVANLYGNQTAVWETTADFSATQLNFTMDQFHGTQHTLGRFRLSVTSDDRSTFADGLDSGGDVTANWTVLSPASVSGTGGEIFTVQGDDSILVSGPSPLTSTYHITYNGIFSNITGVRLEALEDPSLPSNGPGRVSWGNFVVSELSLEATGAAVPEPSTYAMLVLGLLGLGIYRKKFYKK